MGAGGSRDDKSSPTLYKAIRSITGTKKDLEYKGCHDGLAVEQTGQNGHLEAVVA